MGELLAVRDGDVACVDFGTERVEQDLAVDAEGVIPILVLVAKRIQICGFLVLILEGDHGEAVTFAADPFVDSQGIQNP